MKKIALFHPWIKSKGGCERVLLEIMHHKDYDVDLYTWHYDPEHTFPEFKEQKVRVMTPKILRKLSQKIARGYVVRGFFLLSALFSKKIPLEKYDYFLVSTGGVGELVTFANKKPGKTVAYVHTILRASHKDDIFWNLKYRFTSFFKKELYKIAVLIYRILEKLSWRNIDTAIFNSEVSLKRANDHKLLKKKQTHVVYPPILLEGFKSIPQKKGKFFVYINRFSKLKRHYLVVKAWIEFVKKHPDQKLVIGGTIEGKDYFKEILDLTKKTKNIEIKEGPNDTEFKELYANAIAVFAVPFNEDFGIMPFEILAAGKPLIAVNKGGYYNLIKDYEQVIMIKEEKDENKLVEQLVQALEKVLLLKKKPKKIIIDEVSKETFHKKMKEILE